MPFLQEVFKSSEERRQERAQRTAAEDFDDEEAEALEVGKENPRALLTVFLWFAQSLASYGFASGIKLAGDGWPFGAPARTPGVWTAIRALCFHGTEQQDTAMALRWLQEEHEAQTATPRGDKALLGGFLFGAHNKGERGGGGGMGRHTGGAVSGASQPVDSASQEPTCSPDGTEICRRRTRLGTRCWTVCWTACWRCRLPLVQSGTHLEPRWH